MSTRRRENVDHLAAKRQTAPVDIELLRVYLADRNKVIHVELPDSSGRMRINEYSLHLIYHTSTRAEICFGKTEHLTHQK